jgi:hypothetical protein
VDLQRAERSRKVGQDEGAAVRRALEQLVPLDRAARARAIAVLAEQLLGMSERRVRGLVEIANELSAEQLRSAS